MKSPKKRHAIHFEDADRVDDMLDSRGWQLYEQKVLGTIQQLMTDLAQDHTEAVTSKLRGEIAGLQLALKVPRMLVVEAKKKGVSEDADPRL